MNVRFIMETLASKKRPNTWLFLRCSFSLVLFCLAYMSGFNEAGPNQYLNPLTSLLYSTSLTVTQSIEPAWIGTNFSDQCALSWRDLALNETALLSCAVRNGRQQERDALAAFGDHALPRVAFLFITRDSIPHEPLWRRFFRGHEDRYSLYVHSRPDFEFTPDSMFHNHQIPSESVKRLSMSLLGAMRRLLAYAILDTDHGSLNSWFVYVCEATIPIRSFDFSYEFLTNSRQSFVESFLPHRNYLTWETEPLFHNSSLRKGELWMALRRRHAIMVLDDWAFYNKFRDSCREWCVQMSNTSRHPWVRVLDPQGISNWTTMYVNWTRPHWTSPNLLGVDLMTPEWFKDIQGRTVQTDGMFHDTSAVAEQHHFGIDFSRDCVYNGISNSPCYLFARKVNASVNVDHLQSLLSSVLGY